MSKNIVKPQRPQMTIWRRFACWIIKATHAQAQFRVRAPAHQIHTHKRAHTNKEICNTFSSPRQQWFCERALILRYTYIACLVNLIWFFPLYLHVVCIHQQLTFSHNTYLLKSALSYMFRLCKTIFRLNTTVPKNETVNKIDISNLPHRL